METFESLFSELASMKEKSSSLPSAERRAYAEKVAMAFYAALGGSDDELEDLNDD